MAQDSQLKQAVLAELGWDPSVDAAHVGVTANDGVVTLSGHVETYAQKHAAETAASRVRGVQAVAEEIEVLLPFERKRGDDDIAATVLERLAWDVSLPRDAVKVKVEQGWVTLTGAVAWFYQKEAAGLAVRPLTGIVGVSNNISLSPVAGRPPAGRNGVDAEQLCDRITHALHRSWLFDDNNVIVTADGGRVRLAGSVRSAHERQTAAATAWAAPGATSVENALAIR